MRNTARILSAIVVSIIAGSGPLGAQQIDTMALRAHTRFLADDRLQGRDTGSPGERMAREYIASELERIGVVGAAPNGGYFQPVPLKRATINDDATLLALERNGVRVEFRSGEDFVVNTGGAGAFRDFQGQAIFAGTAGLAAGALEAVGTLDGLVVVALGTLGERAESLVPDWELRGAEGVILLVPDPDHFELYVRSRGPSRLFIDAHVDDPIWQPRLPTLIAGPRLSAAILAGADLAPGDLDGSAPFEAIPLGIDVDATIRVTIDEIDAANVAGLIPGTDPERRDEVVAYTAHFDHLGIGTPDQSGDSIYNGFSDNAAGTAMLLAIASAMRDNPPARSVLFLFFTGEERGLLGSTYYATEPLVPLEQTVAVINLDAGAPPAPPLEWNISGGIRSTLGQLARDVADAHGWIANPTDARPNSDHWPFLKRGVPAAFIIPGPRWEGVNSNEREALRLRWDRYHQPSDHWHEDFPFAGLERYATFALELGRAVANADERPRILPPDDR